MKEKNDLHCPHFCTVDIAQAFVIFFHGFQVNEDDDEEHSSTRSKKKTVCISAGCCFLVVSGFRSLLAQVDKALGFLLHMFLPFGVNQKHVGTVALPPPTGHSIVEG